MAIFDVISEFDDALEWDLDDDPLLEPQPAPAWPGETDQAQ
jgi:hypothetical protein